MYLYSEQLKLTVWREKKYYQEGSTGVETKGIYFFAVDDFDRRGGNGRFCAFFCSPFPFPFSGFPLLLLLPLPDTVADVPPLFPVEPLLGATTAATLLPPFLALLPLPPMAPLTALPVPPARLDAEVVLGGAEGDRSAALATDFRLGLLSERVAGDEAGRRAVATDAVGIRGGIFFVPPCPRALLPLLLLPPFFPPAVGAPDAAAPFECFAPAEPPPLLPADNTLPAAALPSDLSPQPTLPLRVFCIVLGPAAPPANAIALAAAPVGDALLAPEFLRMATPFGATLFALLFTDLALLGVGGFAGGGFCATFNAGPDSPPEGNFGVVVVVTAAAVATATALRWALLLPVLLSLRLLDSRVSLLFLPPHLTLLLSLSLLPAWPLSLPRGLFFPTPVPRMCPPVIVGGAVMSRVVLPREGFAESLTEASLSESSEAPPLSLLSSHRATTRDRSIGCLA